MLNGDKGAKNYLKSFGDSCFDDNKHFVPSEEMVKIVSFYGNADKAFVFFGISEENDHRFFEFINQIRVDDLACDTELAAEMDMIACARKIRDKIEANICAEWGYDPSVEITNGERCLSIFIEKFPEAYNFDDSLAECCERSLLADIERSIDKNILYRGPQLETGIYSMLHRNLKYITEETKDTVPTFHISDKEIKNLFIDVCNPLEEIKSRLFDVFAVIAEDAFKFNFSINKVEFRCLTEEELAVQVSKYQRADGQYVFRGAFLPKEEITKMIKDKFTILTLVAQHQVVSSKDGIYELKPYTTGLKED